MVLMGRVGDSAVIKPLVSCSAVLAEIVRGHLRSTSDAKTTDIYFDLSQSASIDSTFAGLLVSLTGGRDGMPGVVVHLAHANDAVRAALTNMHLLGLFDVCDDLPHLPSGWEAMGETPRTAERLCDLIVESHKTLIEADDRNRVAFGPVVDAFEAERKRSSGAPPEAGRD